MSLSDILRHCNIQPVTYLSSYRGIGRARISRCQSTKYCVTSRPSVGRAVSLQVTTIRRAPNNREVLPRGRLFACSEQIGSQYRQMPQTFAVCQCESKASHDQIAHSRTRQSSDALELGVHGSREPKVIQKYSDLRSFTFAGRHQIPNWGPPRSTKLARYIVLVTRDWLKVAPESRFSTAPSDNPVTSVPSLFPLALVRQTRAFA